MNRLLPLAPPGEERGLVYRGLTGAGLVLLTVLLSIACVSMSYIHYFAYDPHVTPLQLYHNTWRVARDNIYDQSKLKDWNEWEHKFDHLIENEEDALRYSHELIAHLNEAYTGLLTVTVVERDKERADGHYVGIGVEIAEGTGGSRLSVGRVVDDGPASKSGVLKGDEIMEVDGVDTTGWSVEKISTTLRGEEGKAVVLTLKRAGKTLSVSVTRGKVPTSIVSTNDSPIAPTVQPTNPAAPPIPSRIGYLRLDSFGQWSTHEQVRKGLEKLAHCDALVIDLRDNPGGFIHEAVRTASLFIDEGVITTTVSRVPEGGYLTTQVSVTKTQILLKNSYGPFSNVPVPLFYRPPYMRNGRPVVLLVNHNSASAAEMFSAALVDNGVAVAIGTTTYGKGIGQTYLPVGNGHKLRITHLKTFTPSGKFLGDAGQTVSNGIKPHIEVEKVGFGAYGTADDNQFQEAVKYLESVLGKKP